MATRNDKETLEVIDHVSDESSSDDEALQEEVHAKELEKLMSKFQTPIYAFFDPTLTIEYRKENRRCLMFCCSAKHCKGKTREVVRYLNTSDAGSTSNMRKHAKICWSEEIVKEADEAKDIDEARKLTKGAVKDGDIMVSFQKKENGKVTYSYRQHMRAETRFNCLMKTGRPHYYLPHPTTVARDVKTVFAKTRKRVSKMLQEYESNINCCIDTWKSPNHHAYAAVTVHFEYEGKLMSMLLDFIEVAEVRIFIFTVRSY
ncbi:hypothetical protein K435DRAFT_821899 [Dendrothele bispora CBS 962.96]|uniref:BED-type domain-containing protein n=1 Tax=Dendrothele bispora (strain CBS 962.96) TaxID=1314807 RepID=A0A4S8LEM1_DENBC|nr:hypothetical protein K435DRAFT_821899 [Dendrothele bispora CBS 962.96]